MTSMVELDDAVERARTSRIKSLEVRKKLAESAPKMKVLPQERARDMGYSDDKRKRRRQHRKNARNLMGAGTFLNPRRAPIGSIPYEVAQWNLFQARYYGR